MKWHFCKKIVFSTVYLPCLKVDHACQQGWGHLKNSVDFNEIKMKVQNFLVEKFCTYKT